MPQSVHPLIETRREQMFPVLEPEEIEGLARFGERKSYMAGERMVATGEIAPGALVILRGRVDVTQRGREGHSKLIVTHGPGSFTGELAQLSGCPSLVDAVATEAVEAFVIPPRRLRHLMVEEAELGERIMRALILRRVAPARYRRRRPDNRRQHRQRRCSAPRRLSDSQRASASAVRPTGRSVCANLNRALSHRPSRIADRFVSRWTAAAQSDRRRTRPLHRARQADRPGRDLRRGHRRRRAGGSCRLGLCGIRGTVGACPGLPRFRRSSRGVGAHRELSYLGFPTGITGLALMARAYHQAQKFGVEMAIPDEVGSLQGQTVSDDGRFLLTLANNERVRAHAVVIASGARYRRLDVENLAAFEGSSVHYWASPLEGRLCVGQEVALVGAGNSAGQAAVYLSSQVAKVWLIVRGSRLGASMSRYLVERITARPNVKVLTETTVTALEGQDGVLEAIRCRSRRSGEEIRHAIRHLFYLSAQTRIPPGCPARA
jgi:thioredoxin reductase (NADPH)